MFKFTDTTHRLKLGLLTLILGFQATPNFAQENYVVAGSAYDLETNQLVYRELYTAINDMSEVKVDYQDPDGKIFASKTLVYQGEPFQPTFIFKDQRDKETISARFDGARLVLAHGLGLTNNEKIIMDNARLVIDAGFDAYIQLNWDPLVAGKRQRFNMAVPSRLGVTQLDVRKVKPTESPLYNSEYGSNWIYFKMAPAQPLKTIFSDPIYLAYDPNGKYLMRFQGRSNIDDNKGAPWNVRIEYEYTN